MSIQAQGMPARLREKIEVIGARLSAAAAARADQDLLHVLHVDHDLDHVDLSQHGGSSLPMEEDLDPDGLSQFIRGKYAELLKTDPAYLQARRWKVHPGTLTNATERMGADWVRQQVAFVSANMKTKNIRKPGGYLSHILKNNPF